MDKDRELEELWYSDVEEDFTGREIEVKRKVDLASYNDYETIAKSTDWVDWTDSENLEFDFLARRILKVYADRFILQATEYGLSRYEKLLKIEPGKNESLEERRKRVYLLWNKKVIWTHRTLLKWLDIAIGKENYDVELFYDEYGIVIDVTVSRNFDLDAFYYMLRWEILPANLDIQIRLSFKTDLILTTQSGDYTYPQFLCGLHLTGTIPRVRWEGQFATVDMIFDSAVDDAKNYYPISGEKHTASQLNNSTITEVINMSDFNSLNYYNFEG